MSSLHEQTLLVTLSLGLPPLVKTDKRISAEITRREGAASGALRATKRLLPENAIEPIKKLHAEIEEFHKQNTLAWGDGTRILRSETFMEYADRMRGYGDQVASLADEFCASYDAFLADARGILNGAFNQKDYLPVERVRLRFRFKLDYAPVPTKDDWRLSMHEAALRELQDSVGTRVAEATRTARAELAQRIAEPLANMVERLSDPEHVFRDSLVTNLRRMCDLIPKLNLTGDPNVEALRQRIHDDLYRSDAETLRESPAVRSSTARKAQDILDAMSDCFGDLAAA